MAEIEHTSTDLPVLARPFTRTQSAMGTTSKLFTERFLVDENSIAGRWELLSEKFVYLQPKSIEFQYLISFSDQSHYEHHQLERLSAITRNSNKFTE